MVVAFRSSSWSHTPHVVLKVTIKGLVLAVFNFKVREIAAAMLSG
jgi:hypothetical protein